jgi:aspartyl-tRNA(Asn)/glutamyl-tRNA(Gln) amidotransferase subunit A
MPSLGTVAFLSAELAAGRTTSRRLVDLALSRCAEGEGPRTFMKVYREAALAEAEASDRLRALGVVRSPVEGIPISVKDLFDVSGDVTLAGSTALASNPPATADATAVARLRAAGAVIVGRTATVEFAFGGVGLNPHYGTPKNPYDRESGGRVPGGSSAGAAVSVADGCCAMGLGSDTRGSVRIPSALCGITGFKPTQRRVPRDGCFPLSYTLDSVGPLASSVACCAVFDAILSAEAPASGAKPPQPLPTDRMRLVVPSCFLLEDLDAATTAAFGRSLAVLRNAGATIIERDAPCLAAAHALYAGGGFSAPEAYHIHRSILAEHRDKYDPRVADRIAAGKGFPADDYIQLGIDRAKAICGAEELMRGFDAMLYPTCPIVAPTLAEAMSSNEAYVRIDLKLLRNTGMANMLDGCAVSLPCQQAGEAPVGLTVAGMGGSDARVLAVALGVEAALAAA